MKLLLNLLIISFSFLMPPLFSHPNNNGATSSLTDQDPLTVDFIIQGGRILKLSDGSTWKIAPQDINTSSVWLFAPPIEIQKNKDTKTEKAYPYKIINKTTGSCVLASPIVRSASNSN